MPSSKISASTVCYCNTPSRYSSDYIHFKHDLSGKTGQIQGAFQNECLEFWIPDFGKLIKLKIIKSDVIKLKLIKRNKQCDFPNIHLLKISILQTIK